MQFAHRLHPRLAARIGRAMPALDSGFSAVAWTTEGLQISEFEGQVRPVADWQHVIDFQPATRAAPDTPEAVAAERLLPQRRPARRAQHVSREAVKPI